MIIRGAGLVSQVFQRNTAESDSTHARSTTPGLRP